MRSVCLLLVILNEILLGNGGNEHVHFKIHVPEIIKHHIHTKTIYIHKTIPRKKHVVKKMKETPKKKMPSHSEGDHKEDHHEWKYWTSYFHHDDHGQSHHDAGHDSKQEAPTGGSYKDYKDSHKYVHENDHPDSSYFPRGESLSENLSPMLHEDYGNGVIGYSYPPQYSGHPETHEVSDNRLEAPTHAYEEGYRKGLRSESGAIYTNELNKFNYDAHEEEDEEEEEQDEEKDEEEDSQNDKENDEVVTTHAGRYFVEEDVDEGSEINKRIYRKTPKG